MLSFTSNFIKIGKIKQKLRFHINVSITINFHQNQLLNECARKKEAETRKLSNYVYRECFFVSYRRTYVLK